MFCTEKFQTRLCNLIALAQCTLLVISPKASCKGKSRVAVAMLTASKALNLEAGFRGTLLGAAGAAAAAAAGPLLPSCCCKVLYSLWCSSQNFRWRSATCHKAIQCQACDIVWESARAMINLGSQMAKRALSISPVICFSASHLPPSLIASEFFEGSVRSQGLNPCL